MSSNSVSLTSSATASPSFITDGQFTCPDDDGQVEQISDGKLFQVICQGGINGDAPSSVSNPVITGTDLWTCVYVCDSTDSCLAVTLVAETDCYLVTSISPIEYRNDEFAARFVGYANNYTVPNDYNPPTSTSSSMSSTTMASSTTDSSSDEASTPTASSTFTCPDDDGTYQYDNGNYFNVSCDTGIEGGYEMGDAFVGMTFTSCADECTQEPGCQAVLFTDDGTCQLESGVGDMFAASGSQVAIIVPASAVPMSSSAVSGTTTQTASTTASSTTISAASSTPSLQCPDADGSSYTVDGLTYVIHCYMDHPGGDISADDEGVFDNTDFATCIGYCADDTSCVGVSFTGGTCQLKSSITAGSEDGFVWFAQLASTTSSSSTMSSMTNSMSSSMSSSMANTMTSGSSLTGSGSMGLSTSAPSSISTSMSGSAYPPSSISFSGSSVSITSVSPAQTRLSCPGSNNTDYLGDNGDEYVIECGVDHYGGVLGTYGNIASMEQCISLCDSSANCVDISYYYNANNPGASTCYTKYIVGTSITDASASNVWGARLISGAALSSTASGTTTASGSSMSPSSSANAVQPCPYSNGTTYAPDSQPKANFSIECYTNYDGNDIDTPDRRRDLSLAYDLILEEEPRHLVKRAPLTGKSFQCCIDFCASRCDCVDIAFIPDNSLGFSGECYLKDALGAPSYNTSVWNARRQGTPVQGVNCLGSGNSYSATVGACLAAPSTVTASGYSGSVVHDTTTVLYTTTYTTTVTVTDNGSTSVMTSVVTGVSTNTVTGPSSASASATDTCGVETVYETTYMGITGSPPAPASTMKKAKRH
ncbi:hypothetical protein K490DRAFT_67094 [Saccharata proteae CBS 121410]|uniref:Apple domain-containing protein n=1 Tax=Saccharata proteae CBS 121410 TaxID=1314787 RepID=A0A9P4LW87_9PEZI|nr:hypothetical protein K490DRAFT_67094 [Saccharata proteae CBS 121410]